jgi:hypothetical protein
MELLRENDIVEIDETDDMSGLAAPNFSLLEESNEQEDISDILVEPRSEIADTDNVIAMLRRGGPRPSRIENQLRDDLAGVIYKIILLFPGTKKRENSSVFALKLTNALMNKFRELAQSGTVKEREQGLTKFKQNASRKFKRSATDMPKSDRASFDMLMGQFNRLIQAIRQERKRVIRRRYTAADMAIPTRRRAGQGRKTPPRKKRAPQKKTSKSTISRMNTRLANIRKKRKAAGVSGRKEEHVRRQMQDEKMRSMPTGKRRSPVKKSSVKRREAARKKAQRAAFQRVMRDIRSPTTESQKAEKDRIRREEKALKERAAKRRKAARQKEQQRAAFQRVMREIRSPRKKGRLSRREQLLAMTPKNPSAMLDSLASLDLAVALQQPGITLDAPSRRLLAHSLRILRYTPQWQWRKEPALTEPVRQAIARVLSIRANRERLDRERREYELASRVALQGLDDDDEDAPDYSPDSGYVPGSPDYGVISSPVYDPGSPAYMPYSPGYAAESRPAEESDDMVELDLGPPVVQTKRLSEMDMSELKDLAKEVSSEKEVDSLLKKNKARSDRRKALMNLIIKKRLRRTSEKRSSKKQTKIDAERSIAEIKMKLRQEGVGFDEKGRAVISPLVSSGFAKSLLDELEVLEKIAYGKSKVKAKRPARKPKSPARAKRVLYSMKWGCVKNENKSNPRIPKLWMIVGYEEEDFGSGDVRRYVKLKDSSGKGRVKQMKVSDFEEKYQRKEEYEAEMEKLSSELLDQFLADGGNRKDFSLVDALCPKRRKKKKKSAKPSSPGRAAGASGFRVGDIVMKVKGARSGEQVRITSVDANGKVGGVFVSDGKTCRKSSSANFSK